MAADPDAVEAVLAALPDDRGARLVRRFDHGVGGTSLVEVDGELRVLKAWRSGSGPTTPELDRSLALAETVRRRGVAVPALIERGILTGCPYLLYERLDGEWPAALGPAGVDGLFAVLDRARDAAPQPNPRWAAELAAMLDRGEPGLDLRPAALAGVSAAADVLARARRRLAACPPERLRTTDVVHGDFAPENLLLRDDRVVGVVDWERARVGDGRFDLVGALFDLEIGDKLAPDLRTAFWDRVRGAAPAEVLGVYVGLYAVRYLSWAVGTEMEDEVLQLSTRLLAATEVSGDLPAD